MGNNNTCCTSRTSLFKEETFSLFNICLSVLKNIIAHVNKNDHLIIFESSYTFLSSLFQILDQSTSFPDEVYRKLRECLLNLSKFIFLEKENTMNEEKCHQLAKIIKEIQDSLNLKCFEFMRFKTYEEILEETSFKGLSTEGFSTIKAAKFWYENFNTNNEIEWDKFYEKFSSTLQTKINGDVSKQLLFIIKDILDINNNLKVDKSGWDNFYLKYFSDWCEMRNLMQNLMLGSFYVKNSLTLIYIGSPNDKKMEEFYFKIPTKFIISDQGLISPKEYKLEKNLNEKGLIFGRENDQEDVDVLFHRNLKEIYKKQFQIISKYIKTCSGFDSEFYFNNLSIDFPSLFVVEQKGYALSNNSIIFLNNEIKICVKLVSPSFSPIFNDGYYFIDPNYGKNKINFNEEKEDKTPFIIFLISNENKEKKFIVWNPASDFEITIGNSYENDVTIAKTDPNHCSIKYSYKDKTWFILDGTKNERSSNRYRTFLSSIGKGIKLRLGMKIWVGGHVFEVE